MNRLQYSPIQNTQIMLIHRFYSYDYWAMFAHSFGEGSTTQNEQGYYIGMELLLLPIGNSSLHSIYFLFLGKDTGSVNLPVEQTDCSKLLLPRALISQWI